LHRGKRYSLLVVRDDGARIERFSIPRQLPLLILGGVAVLVAALLVLIGDRWFNRAHVRENASLLREIDVQRVAIEGLNRRMSEVHAEVASWHALHARIWEPFGPDGEPKGPRTGIGGATGSSVASAVSRIIPSAPDEVDRLSMAVREEGEKLRALERLISRAGKALAALPSRWPVRGPVNSEFGGRRSPWTSGSEFHSGIDIAAERGTPVQAPAAGTVAFAGPHAEYGLTVVVDHGEDLRTIYGHLSKIGVALGQKIERGGELGLTGNTGRSSGPHLHYEILVRNRPVNPRAFFWN
jgi:hypothetical protein